jgi:hypothetical protein
MSRESYPDIEDLGGIVAQKTMLYTTRANIKTGYHGRHFLVATAKERSHTPLDKISLTLGK